MKEKWFNELKPVILETRRPFNWKLWLVVFLMSTFGMFMAIPYTLTLLPETAQINDWLIIGQMLGNSIIYGGLAAIGLLLAGKLGLGLPFIDGLINRKITGRKFLPIALLAILIGVVGSIFIITLDSAVFTPKMVPLIEKLSAEQIDNIHPPAWQWLMASFEGGITEEVLLRLFFLTVITWMISLIWKNEDGRPKLWVLWIANILAAVIFGVAHLPATVAMGIPATAVVITRAIVLNGALGVAFGWLYWRYGLESAMIAHFSADIVLHVIFVLMLPFFN